VVLGKRGIFLHSKTGQFGYSNSQKRCLRVASGATALGPALEGAPRFRPKVVLMSLSSYILRYIGNADTCSV